MYEQIFKRCCYICTYMEKPEWTKTKGFRLPQRTLDQLDYLTTDGGFRNATEAIIIAVDRLYMQEQFGTTVLEDIDIIADYAVKYPQIVDFMYKNMKDPLKREEYHKRLNERIKEKSESK